jgi:nitroreductase
MSTAKKPALDHPVHEIIARRWSPYLFADKEIATEDLRSIFEAARWAASAFNEQPWRYIVATKANQDQYSRLLSCLVEPNQAWARKAPVLALGVVGLNYSQNGKPNGTALHDLGLASAHLTLEAAARGIFVHQMGGILPDRARELFNVPEDFAVLTGLALGYPGSGEGDLAQRDSTLRGRRPQEEFVFTGTFGQALVL